jgi:hypothetical protein
MSPTNLSNEDKARLIEAALQAQTFGQEANDLGPPTALACPHCNGVLHERHLDTQPPTVKHPPLSKNRRIRKKQLKRWYAENWPFYAVHAAMLATRSSGFRCISCKRLVGFYHAIGRNLIKVEPMPPGALPYYEGDLLGDVLTKKDP